MPASTIRTRSLNLRLTPADRKILSTAARAAHRSVGRFVLESALERAGAALHDRNRFVLDDARWRRFMAALDAPPRALPRPCRPPSRSACRRPDLFEGTSADDRKHLHLQLLNSPRLFYNITRLRNVRLNWNFVSYDVTIDRIKQRSGSLNLTSEHDRTILLERELVSWGLHN